MRTITESNEIIHISIGEKTQEAKLNKIVSRIDKSFQEANIVILTNIELSKPAKSKKADEQDQLAKIIQTSSSAPLLTVFQKTLKLQKKKPEIVAYVNPGDFGKT